MGQEGKNVTGSMHMKAKYEDLKDVELVKGVSARFFPGEKMMFSFVRLGAGILLPNHSHPHEQMGYILEGSLTLTIEGEEFLLKKGDMYIVRGGQNHEAVGGDNGALALDVFSPPREEYLEKIK
jgi:quercetin dioxygenase-like cupin family protein